MLGIGNGINVSSAIISSNYSVTLDGDDYLTVSDDNSVSFGDGSADSNLSISFWLKVDDISDSGAFQGILVKGEEYEIHINTQYDRMLFRRVDNSANTRFYRGSSNSSVIEGVWQHFLITSDDSELHSGVTWYINGSAATHYGGGTDGGYVASENDSTDLYIG